jgi:hypothetical protein
VGLVLCIVDIEQHACVYALGYCLCPSSNNQKSFQVYSNVPWDKMTYGLEPLP